MNHYFRYVNIFLMISISIFVSSCAPYTFELKQQKRPIYTTDDKGAVKRDRLSEHIRDSGCGPRAGNECGKPFG